MPWKLSRQLTTPYELCHGDKPCVRTWLPLLSGWCFNHVKDSNLYISSTQSQTLAGIAIGCMKYSNTMSLCNPTTIRIYTTGNYYLDLGWHMNTLFFLKYNGGIFVGTHSYYSNPIINSYLPGTKILYRPPNSDPIKGAVCSIHIDYTGTTSPEEDTAYYIHLQNSELISLTL